MKENAEQLTKAINERKVVYTSSHIGGPWTRYFITDEHTAVENIKLEAIESRCEYNRVKKELNELRDESKRHYELEEKRFAGLSKAFNEYTEASLLTRIIRVFNKQY
jgi:hypothetical protein